MDRGERNRRFASSSLLLVPPCRHDLAPEPVDVTGHNGGRSRPRSRKPRNLDHARTALGIDWMNRAELSQAIPPAYTEHIGRQLIGALRTW